MQIFELKTVEKIEEFCTLEIAKNHLRVTSNHDDFLILSQLKAAITFAEEFLKKFIEKREVIASLDDLKGAEVYVTSEPLINVLNLKIIDDNEEVDLVETRDFKLVGNKIILKNTYIKRRIQIKYIAGYEVVPELIRQGIFLHLSLLYDKQVINNEILEGILLMYQSYRKLRII